MTIPNIALTIEYDTSLHSRHAGSYRVRMNETQEQPSPLRQVGPIYNNIVTHCGVFLSKCDAAKAVLGYVDGSYILLERADPVTGKTVHLRSAGDRPPREVGVTFRLLARRDSRGEFVAAAR